jgi:hypothetical protein
MNYFKNCLFYAGIIFMLISCKKDCPTPDNNLYGTGWDNDENYSQNIPVAINYGNYQSNSSLPAFVDLTPKFPPIGDQGLLGTCVAWSVGYNTKSYLDGISNSLNSNQLQSENYQYSPTDLFFSISSTRRFCDRGTQFEYAFDVLMTRGVNTLANVPYDGICRSTSPGNSVTASSNKIKNYRRIDGSINQIKEYLAQGVPVVIGAMVNSQFQYLSGPDVLRNLDYSRGAGGHAMVIAGYDDSKSAFRIINSWGTGWGDNGYLWVDYNFLVNKFCIQGGKRSLFVVFNDNNTTIVNPPANTSGSDLTAIVSSDYSRYPNFSSYTNARKTYFDVKNIGNQTVNSSSGWNIYYLWVNAFDVNNYGIILKGEFTNSIPQNTYQNINNNYCLFNVDLEPGASMSQKLFGTATTYWDYFMPGITGSYYLVFYIDKGNSNDVNQTNNVFYVTQSPKYFNNGYSSRQDDENANFIKYNFGDLNSFKHELSKVEMEQENMLQPYRNLSISEFQNAYNSDEIVGFLKNKIKSGGL